MMTDGRSNSENQTLLAASEVHSFEPSINVYAIGVTNSINQYELDAASQESYVSLISFFDSSLLDNLQQQQSYELCYRGIIIYSNDYLDHRYQHKNHALIFPVKL